MQVSIVIPVLNEANCIEHAIRRAWQAGAHEVIVVDGGSQDATCDIAHASDCTLVTSAMGRAAQQDAGGRAAHGDVLLFLHADNWLVADGIQQIVEACDGDRRIVGGFHDAFHRVFKRQHETGRQRALAGAQRRRL